VIPDELGDTAAGGLSNRVWETRYGRVLERDGEICPIRDVDVNGRGVEFAG